MIQKHDVDPMELEDSVAAPIIDNKHDIFGKIPKKYRRIDEDSSDSSNDNSSDDSSSDSSDDSSSDSSDDSSSDSSENESNGESESDQSKTEAEENIATSSSDKLLGKPLYYDSNYMVDKWIQKAYRSHVDEALELAAEMCEEDEDLDSLKRRVRKKLLPKYRKQFRKLYQKSLLQMEAFRKNPVHKSVMKTVKKLKRRGGLDKDEAIRKAVTERKHLINRLVASDSEESSEEIETTDDGSTEETEGID
jgi:vacuolar-type H+-ATPase catalytic subunit A/Vma1